MVNQEAQFVCPVDALTVGRKWPKTFALFTTKSNPFRREQAPEDTGHIARAESEQLQGRSFMPKISTPHGQLRYPKT